MIHGNEGKPIGGLPEPEPVPNRAAYRRERRLALASSPRRLMNYLLFRATRHRNVKTRYLPIRLDIENVSRCNFSCDMCLVSEWPKGKRASDMPVDDFRRLIDEQYGLLEIKLQGLGEPLLQGAPFFEMIRYARRRHIWVRTTTNASILHLNDNYRHLVDTGVNEIQVSIDGADAKTFEAIRRQSDFDRVMANCVLLNTYCRDRGVERTKMWTVVQRANRHQLPDLVDLAQTLGFRHLVFSTHVSGFTLDRRREVNRRLTPNEPLDREEAGALTARGARQSVNVRFWNATERYSTARRETRCPWPFERGYISSDLRAVPCCTIANPDTFELGTMRDGLTPVWRGRDMDAFRAAHRRGEIPPVCRSCYSEPAVPASAADRPGTAPMPSAS